MAPAAATVTGVQRQTIDDLKLITLLERLRGYDPVTTPPCSKNDDCDDSEVLSSSQIIDIEGLVGELERWPQWRFQELADLYEWIGPLNAMDAALSQLMSDNPAILLISSTSESSDTGDTAKVQTQAESESEANSVPPSVIHATATILRFLSNLLRNATNKQVFNSVRELNDLLAAADDTIASLALEALSSLAMPPFAHRHQTPEAQPPTNALHTDSPRGIHARLMTLAKGWGSRGSGLGLADCVIADDSASGQGALPSYAGEVRYEFLPPSSSRSLTVLLSTNDITSTAIPTDHQQEKRRKMAAYSITGGPASRPSKSTSNLFFQALQQIGGRSQITTERLFTLLVHIRLAASFHSQQTRVAAVERRLHALLAALYAHQSHDVLVGYFYAQQELCGELADLIRPTVSSSAVSSSSTSLSRRKRGVRGSSSAEEDRRQGAIAAIVDTSSGVPYDVRSLAVEVLTALVARNDDSNANVSQVARQSNALTELGVGKGQFLGLLPTLMRYSLASLNAFLSPGNRIGHEKHAGTSTRMDIDTDDEGRKPMSEDEQQASELKQTDSDTDLDIGLDLGLTFLEATKSPPLERRELEEKALEFIELVLSLVFAVITFPTGTAALTDCGLVPALVSTIALDSHVVQMGGISPFATEECRMNGEESYADSLLKFIIAQAIQILEGTLSTHGPALSAFYDLKGSDLLVTRLHVEVERIRKSSEVTLGSDIIMETSRENNVAPNARPLKAAGRALIFSIVTCLTVVFHRQETTSRTASSTLSAGMQLQKPEMTNAFIDIMDNVWSYGGAMAALTCTLLSHIMNADPQVVHYVHTSGLANSFLRMIKGITIEGTTWFEPNFPPSPDLIMALPNVISALALTEDGAKRIREANPIQELMGILCGPKYVMPQTRCLLNEVPSFIGSGLDEIMRYVPSLKRTTMETIVTSISKLVKIGEDIFEHGNELKNDITSKRPTEDDDSRTRFIQYTHNIGQVLEQVLQNDEHCTPFVDAGGIEQLLKLYPLLMPTGRQLLSHISCQSAPSVASLTHSTTANVLMSSVKRLAANDESHKAITSVVICLDIQLNELEQRLQNLREHSGAEKVFKNLNTSVDGKGKTNLNTSGILEGIPLLPLHQLKDDDSTEKFLRYLSLFMNSILSVEWMTHVLSSVIKAAVLSGWGKTERDWQKDISSDKLQSVLQRLSTLHLYSLHEVCRIRSTSAYEDRDEERWKAADESNCHPASYSLRIVCPDGAVLRDGIEIDSCASIGGLEMGEVIGASDRCINGSGIMRYRTEKGWISEQTRGCAREPVVEVLSFHGVATRCRRKDEREEGGKTEKCIECGVPDLCSISAAVLARLQNSQSNLYSSLGRLIMYGFRSLSSTTDAQQGTIKVHISALVKHISHSLSLNFSAISLDSAESLSEAGISMYFGNMLNILHTCLYEDKRDKTQVLNVLFLCNMLLHDGVDNVLFTTDNIAKTSDDEEGEKVSPTSGFLSAIRFVIKFGLSDMAKIAKENALKDVDTKEGKDQLSNRAKQRVSKAVASSFPSAISLLRKLVSKSLGIDQQIRSCLSKMKSEDLRIFLIDDARSTLADNDDLIISYQNFLFVCAVNCSVGAVALELWTNPHLVFAPSYVMNPIVSLLGETLTSLEECSSEHSSSEGSTDSAFRSLSTDNRGEYLGLRGGITQNLSALNSYFGVARPSSDDNGNEEEHLPPAPPLPFEPSEDTVRLMIDMGFGREHALHAIETTESNTIDITMEYALAHPPPSPASIARRREARDARQRLHSLVANASLPPPIENNNISDGIQPNASATASSLNANETADPMDIEASNATSSQEASTSDKKNAETNATETKKVERDDMSANEKKLLWKKQAGIEARKLVDTSMKSIRTRVMDTAIIIIEGPKDILSKDIVPEKIGDGGNDEVAVVTVVICSFLLELCERHIDERSAMVTQLLHRMKSHLHIDSKGSSCTVTNGNEYKFASLCHAAVLFLRALPKTRPLVLKNDLVSCLVQCVRGLTSKLRHRHNSDLHKWPRWLSPTLLLLDVMAQPMTLPSNDKEKDISDNTIAATHSGRRGEYARVCAEHKRQGIILSKASKRISMAISLEGGLHNKKGRGKEKDWKKSGIDKKSDDVKPSSVASQQSSTDEPTSDTKEKDNAEGLKSLSNTPIFMPLITQDTADFCLSVCLQLLRCHLKWHGRNEDGRKKANCLPPTVTHAALLLLTRILRSHGCASQFLKLGGAELLLSLQSKSRFQGHVRLVTVALRRMLEDEITLQTAMETEIRSTVAKLQKKQARGPENHRTKIEARSFVQAVTPLICRDPLVFLKAAATSIRVESSSSDAPRQQMYIAPLSVEERMKNSRALTDYFRNDGLVSSNANGNHSCTGVAAKNQNPSHKRGRQQQKTKPLHVAKQLKTKSPHRHVATKRVNNPKKINRSRQEKPIILNGSPSNHVTTLLLNELLKAVDLDTKSTTEENLPFLCIVEYLEIIADLVLAIPACAAAIHRYHPTGGRDPASSHEIESLSHALSGCPNPPKNFVSYLLHKLLPQPRSYSMIENEKSFQNIDANGIADAKLAKKRKAYVKAKISQSTARLLVVLVARAGEGRRRVISDLALALNGQGAHHSEVMECDDDNHQLWALRVWGELCIGLAAPRSSGVNQDSNSSLSFEVVRVMMECGMAHSLMYGISRIKLHHPLAASASAALLRPLEVFTRPSVAITLHEMAEKEDRKAKTLGSGDGGKGDKITLKRPGRISIGPSQQSESAFADDAMLGDGFDADTAESARRRDFRLDVDDDDGNSFDDEVEDREEFSDDDDDAMEGSANYDEDDDIDEEDNMSEGDSDDSDASDSSEETDSASSVNDSLEDTNESESSEEVAFDEEMESSNGTDEDDGELDAEDDEENNEENDEDNDEDTYQWDEEGNDDFFEGHLDVEEEAAESGDISGVGDIEEGWTRIEPGPVGRMMAPMFGGRGTLTTRPRNGGSMIEAAEAVLGNFLRAGEIEMEAIAEIENTLVRISSRGADAELPRIRLRAVTDLPPSHRNRAANRTNGNLNTQNHDPVGLFPSVNQNPPENAFSSTNIGSRLNDINSMEYLYGGSPFGSDRIHYDLRNASNQNDQQNINHTLTVPSTLDTDLFPGGPAASTHTRPQLILHPLLSAVNLPPSNALVSAVMRQSSESSRVRLPNTADTGWNLNSRGTSMSWNLSSRGVSLTTFERPATSGVGRDLSNWTDDGQPLDSPAAEFSLAFQQTLGHTILHDPVSQRSCRDTDNNDGNNSGRGLRGADEEAQSSNEQSSDLRAENPEASLNAESSSSSSASVEEAIVPVQVQQNEISNVGSDNTADHVTSSLAPGTSLSSQSEPVADTGGALAVQNNDSTMTVMDTHNEEGSVNIERPSIDGEIENSGTAGLSSEEINAPSDVNIAQSSQSESDEQQTAHANDTRIDCPPGMDVEVFSQLPIEMQQEVVAQHQATTQVADQLDSSSSLDPEALAALPEDMRREVIQQEQNERRLREQEEAPADPSNAEEMDNASFLASLTPDIREQVLRDMENDPEIDLRSLPPDILAEVHLMRERDASTRTRRSHDEPAAGTTSIEQQARGRFSPNTDINPASASNGPSNSRKRNKVGKMRVDCDRLSVVYTVPTLEHKFGPLVTVSSMKAIISIMYLLSPVRQKLLHKLLLNLCGNQEMRRAFVVAFVALLNDEPQNARRAIHLCGKQTDDIVDDEFPPTSLVGTVPDIRENESTCNGYLSHRRKNITPAAAIAANFPVSAMASFNDVSLPPVVARRIVGTLSFLSRNPTRVSLDLLHNFDDVGAKTNELKVRSKGNLECLDTLLGLLGKPLYSQSSSNLDDLLNMIESICQPLSFLSAESHGETELTKRELDAASAASKEWIRVPRVVVSPQRLQLLCSILRLETCKDASFSKINTIARCLCKVDANRDYITKELASVAQSLGADAIRDLRSLSIRLNDAVTLRREHLTMSQIESKSHALDSISAPSNSLLSGTSVTLSTSSSELKLLRVLQSLHSLCGEPLEDGSIKRNDVGNVANQELVCLLNSINLESLWEQLACCLKDVSVLEGVNDGQEIYEKKISSTVHLDDSDENHNQIRNGKKKLQNSVAGLLSRFLPTIEAFFVVNSSSTVTLPNTDSLHDSSAPGKSRDIGALVGGRRLIEFVGENKVLLNALLRSNPPLLDKGLRAMVQVPRCRPFLDFDIKRQWFKTQVRRLRQASRRHHGSLRLNIRRQNVFADAYHQLRLRNADEMRGRLQITFTNEEGVDAGGLSREFFGILAKEMFNPNYALFTSTEDGCTFQPNPHSNFNPDHLSYFRFVGRIVGKAVVDGFLLDAHFTRSLYKHMLGVKPTHHDMQAIDPDYYKNLKMMLEYNLEDIGLDLTLSTEDHSFGRSRTIDLIKNGRNTKVTEENKEKYVSLVCQHRMTTAIEEQIKAYLDGFYELVKPDLISIFTAKELELLISGMPDIDIHDLKKHTDYQGYKASDKEIGWFWKILSSLSRSEKAAFLQFVTGSSKVPLAGFAELQGMRGIQKFSIHKARGSSSALMSAHTCFNALDLPVYTTEVEMKEKLLYAILEGNEGFLFA